MSASSRNGNTAGSLINSIFPLSFFSRSSRLPFTHTLGIGRKRIEGKQVLFYPSGGLMLACWKAASSGSRLWAAIIHRASRAPKFRIDEEFSFDRFEGLDLGVPRPLWKIRSSIHLE